MDKCEFCEIVAKDAPVSLIYDDADSLAMLTLRPMNHGHTLVIPKDHAESLDDLPEETGGHLFRVGMEIAEALRTSDAKCDGVNFWLADGRTAGQEVFHVHLHIIPRFEQDDIRLEGTRIDTSRSEMDATARDIQSRL